MLGLGNPSAAHSTVALWPSTTSTVGTDEADADEEYATALGSTARTEGGTRTSSKCVIHFGGSVLDHST